MTALGFDERLALVREMPMTFHSLVIEYTSHCNARCGMCYQAAGPRGSDLIGSARLDAATAARVIREGVDIETIGPRCHITGGEGFLHSDLLLELVRVASDAGYAEVTTTTNGFWARDRRKGDALAARARRAGMTSLELSWDAWHAPFIPAEAVNQCLEACFEHGIDVNLRILGTRTHTYAEALAALDPAALTRASRITCAPVMPMGRAAAAVPLADVYSQGAPGDTCHAQLNLTINARGHVSPCCSGLDQIREPLFGSVLDRPLAEVVAALDRSLLARWIVFQGVDAVAELAREMGGAVDGTFTSICHQCWVMFSRPEVVAAVEAALERRSAEALRCALDALGGAEASA